jgi:hypothetical protein
MQLRTRSNGRNLGEVVSKVLGARRPSELELLLGDSVLNSQEAEIQVRERLGLAVPLRVLTPTRLSEMISEARRAGRDDDRWAVRVGKEREGVTAEAHTVGIWRLRPRRGAKR